jgi:hypothetical protein
MKRNRFIIYAKDVQLITGRSERYAQYIIAGIKKWRKKEKHQLVTYAEFCEYTGIDPRQLDAYLATPDSEP